MLRNRDGREGKCSQSARFKTDSEGLKEFTGGVEEALVAMELDVCGQPLYKGLEEAGYNIWLMHPQKAKDIAQSKGKPINRLGNPRPPVQS